MKGTLLHALNYRDRAGRTWRFRHLEVIGKNTEAGSTARERILKNFKDFIKPVPV